LLLRRVSYATELELDDPRHPVVRVEGAPNARILLSLRPAVIPGAGTPRAGSPPPEARDLALGPVTTDARGVARIEIPPP
jgi:hypothetical protein